MEDVGAGAFACWYRRAGKPSIPHICFGRTPWELWSEIYLLYLLYLLQALGRCSRLSTTVKVDIRLLLTRLGNILISDIPNPLPGY
jgi:hypothetical protein